MKRSIAAVSICLLTLAFAATPAGAAARSCGSIVNPYAGTRYEGVDLSRITARGASCAIARRVARGAHRRALGLTPSSSGIRRFGWGGWRVRGDLRGGSDSYLALKGNRRVRWRF